MRLVLLNSTPQQLKVGLRSKSQLVALSAFAFRATAENALHFSGLGFYFALFLYEKL